VRFDFARLARTGLYGAVWSGRVPADVAGAPPLSVWQWRRHVHEQAHRSLTTEPALWVLYPIPGDDPIWIPFGPRDLETGAAGAQRMLSDAGVSRGDVVLAVAPPAPWAGNTLPYLFSSADRLVAFDPPARADSLRSDEGLAGVAVFPLSVTTVEYKSDLAVFPLSRGPTVIAGSRGDMEALLALAQRAGQRRPRFRLALVVGFAVAAHASDLSDSTAELLYVPGMFAPAGGRPDVPGVWLPPAAVHVELIPDEEWGRAAQDPSRVPAILTAAESVGAAGELVVTVANSVLPVIRLRTALRVRVADADPAVGIRIEVLNRMAPRTRDAAAAFAPAARPGRTRQNHRADREA